MAKTSPARGEHPLSDFLDQEVMPRLSASDVFTWPGHNWQEAGTKWRGACPWHDSKSGSSFYIDTTTLLWRCTGCEVGGGPLQYLYSHQVGKAGASPRQREFVDLVKQLAHLAGVEMPERQYTPEQFERARFWDTRRAILQAVASHAHAVLLSDVGAACRRYLERRGLDTAALDAFQVGYLPALDVQAVLAPFDPKDVQATRLDKLAGYLIFPWADAYGRPLTLYGRWPGEAPAGTAKLMALPGEGTKQSPLYFDRVRAAGHHDVVLVEGVLDAAVLHANGDSRVVACVATSFSEGQIATLKRHQVEAVTICLDPDAGGDNGTLSCIRRLRDAGILAYVAPRLPDGLDPDEFLQREGLAGWHRHIDQAIPGAVHQARRILARYTLDSPRQHQSAQRECMALAQSLLETERSVFYNEVAQTLGMTLDELHTAEPQAAAAAHGTGEGRQQQGRNGQTLWTSGPTGDTTRPREPLPLQRELPPAESYPIEALGDILSPMAKVLMEVVKAPDAICCQAVLAASAVAVQAHGNVVVDGRTHPTSEYFGSIAESGDRKTTADGYALYPHRQWEKKQAVAYKAAFQAFQDDDDAYRKAREEELRKAKGHAAKRIALNLLGPPPVPPLEPLFLVQEPTYEGLIKLLLVARPSLGLFNDEGGRFIYGHGMNQDNLLKTASGLSDLWDGKAINRVRAGDGTVLLYGRRLSMHLMAQPGVAMHLLGNPELLDQGLLSRCLVAFPQSLAGTRSYKAYDVTQDPAVQAYNARLSAILDHPPPLEEGAQNELTPRRMTLRADAKRRWVAFYDHVEPQLAVVHALSDVRGFASKLAEHALRLAGILTLVGDIEAKEIAMPAMEAGITLAEFYCTEALRLFHQSTLNPDLELALTLLRWAQPQQHIYLRQIYQYGPNSIREAATAKRIVAILEEHGWLHRVKNGMELDGAHRFDAWEVVA